MFNRTAQNIPVSSQPAINNFNLDRRLRFRICGYGWATDHIQDLTNAS